MNIQKSNRFNFYRNIILNSFLSQIFTKFATRLKYKNVYDLKTLILISKI